MLNNQSGVYHVSNLVKVFILQEKLLIINNKLIKYYSVEGKYEIMIRELIIKEEIIKMKMTFLVYIDKKYAQTNLIKRFANY